jgi:hypothetical protein
MAITSVTIVQDNMVGGCDLLAVHSPLKFLAEVTDSDSPYIFPDYLDVEVTDLLTAITYTGYKAWQYYKLDDKARYIFNAEKILRAIMGDFSDVDGDSIDYPNFLVRQFRVKFKYLALNDYVDFNAYTCARQVGQTECVTEVASNADDNIIAFANREFYMHFYSSGITGAIVFDNSVVDASNFVRKRKTIETVGTSTAVVTVDAVTAKTFNITTMPDDPCGLYVKFLDSNTGYYKHWLFSRYFEISGEHEAYGTVENFSLNLLQEVELEIGKKFKRKFLINADLTQSEMDYIKGLLSSPRIYYLNENDKWISVKLDNSTNTLRYPKNNTGVQMFTLVEAPQNTVTML